MNQQAKHSRRKIVKMSMTALAVVPLAGLSERVLATQNAAVRTVMENEMSDTNTLESFPSMLRRVLGDRLKPDATTFLDMFSTDGVLEYPYAPSGLRTPLVGRDAIIANFQIIRKLLRIDNVTEVVVYETADRHVVMIEFEGHGEGLITKESYNQRYISVIRVRDGHIVHYKDYWNPLALLRTLKGEEVMKAVAMD